MTDNQRMLIQSIKRYFDRKRKPRKAAPVVLSARQRATTKEPEVLWSRERRPADLGSLKQELGSD